jgi:hypothetical protein
MKTWHCEDCSRCGFIPEEVQPEEFFKTHLAKCTAKEPDVRPEPVVKPRLTAADLVMLAGMKITL